MAASAPVAEVTVSWGEDTICASCCCVLPAGAPAWPDGDGRLTCVGCVAADGAGGGR